MFAYCVRFFVFLCVWLLVCGGVRRLLSVAVVCFCVCVCLRGCCMLFFVCVFVLRACPCFCALVCLSLMCYCLFLCV